MAYGNMEPTEPSPNIYSTPPVTSSPYYGEASTPKPKSRKIKIVIGFIVGVLLISTVGATLALYTRAWDPLWNPFRPEPEKIIQEMTQRMKQVKTIHTETKINTEIKNDHGSAEISIASNGDVDTSDTKNPKSAGDFSFGFSTKSPGSYGPNEINFSLGGEAKALGNIFYFRINTLPALIVDSLRNETGIDLNETFTNKWIKIDSESITQSLEDLFKNYYFGGNLPPEFENLFQQQIETQNELQKKFGKIIEGKKFFIVKKELLDTEISGIESYHYLMNLDKKELKSLIPEFAILYVDMIKEMMPPDYPLTDEDIYQAKKEITESLNKAFDEFFAKVGDIDGEVWIGKKDYLLYKVKMDKLIDLSKINTYSEGTITLGVDINFSNFDKPVIIEEPKEYKTLEEIIKPIFEKVIKAQAYQETIESMDSISNTAEYFFYTSQDYRNVKCENTQYFKYSCDKIEKYTGSKPTIRSSKKEYCAYVKLPPKYGITTSQINYYCIDSRGIKDEFTLYPGGTNYCNGITFNCPSGLIR